MTILAYNLLDPPFLVFCSTDFLGNVIVHFTCQLDWPCGALIKQILDVTVTVFWMRLALNQWAQ